MIAFYFDSLFFAFRKDTLQKIMLDHSIQYCSYYISYRDSDAEIMDNINQLIECIQVQGHSQFYSIRVGPIAKEAVNTLVSESLVSTWCFENIMLTQHAQWPDPVSILIAHATDLKPTFELPDS